MRFTEIGQQLRAYRLESGLRAEEIAARLGVSRAALYRYEKGEVIKLDTVKRLAEMLNISPLSLLGIGVEYYNRPIGFFERLRQLEETADQVLRVSGPVCYLTTTAAYDAAVAEVFDDVADRASAPDAAGIQAMAEQLTGLMAARKRAYGIRRPGIISIFPLAAVDRFLRGGVGFGLPVSERVRRLCRQAAEAEVAHLATLMEGEPMGLQFGILPDAEPSSAFEILRARDRATLATAPFRPDGHPASQDGVAMITSADEAVAAHQRVAENCWRNAVKGNAAATRLREMLSRVRTEEPAV